MRAALLVIAGIALLGFLAVAVVLPRMAGSEAREAAQALVAGAEPAKQQVTAAAEKSGRLEGAGDGVKVAAKNDPKHGEMKWIVSQNGAIRGSTTATARNPIKAIPAITNKAARILPPFFLTPRISLPFFA